MSARARPSRAQTIGIGGAPAGPAGKAAVGLRLDQWDHVHAVDAQEALAVEEPRRVDVRPPHVDRAHHDAGQVSPAEPGATQVHVDELRSLQVVRAGEGCHDFSFPSARATAGARESVQASARWHCPERPPRLSTMAWQTPVLCRAEGLGRGNVHRRSAGAMRRRDPACKQPKAVLRPDARRQPRIRVGVYRQPLTAGKPWPCPAWMRSARGRAASAQLRPSAFLLCGSAMELTACPAEILC
jgi:hypothetical protein